MKPAHDHRPSFHQLPGDSAELSVPGGANAPRPPADNPRPGGGGRDSRAPNRERGQVLRAGALVPSRRLSIPIPSLRVSPPAALQSPFWEPSSRDWRYRRPSGRSVFWVARVTQAARIASPGSDRRCPSLDQRKRYSAHPPGSPSCARAIMAAKDRGLPRECEVLPDHNDLTRVESLSATAPSGRWWMYEDASSLAFTSKKRASKASTIEADRPLTSSNRSKRPSA